MKRRITFALVMALCGLVGIMGSALAGGPVCPPPVCGPPVFCPPPACPPPTCCPPPSDCRPNPLAMILSGAVRLVTGVIALPFRVVDSVLDHVRCGPGCCPPRVAMCPPPLCPPPGCGPAFGPPPPGFGYGAMAPPPPVGFGRGVPKRYSPMVKEKNVLPLTLMAAPGEGFFGTYW
jgi:hypothetical protein